MSNNTTGEVVDRAGVGVQASFNIAFGIIGVVTNGMHTLLMRGVARGMHAPPSLLQVSFWHSS